MIENVPIWVWVIFVMSSGIILLGSGVVSFIIMSRLRWNFRWVLIENGEITKRGRCRIVSFGDGGEEVFYLKGIKKWRVAYGKRIGKNQIAWAVGGDGYWYNVDLGALDEKLREVGVEPVDRDLRLAYAAIRKGLEHRYSDKTFMEKYGTAISISLIILALIVGGASNYYAISKSGQNQLAAAENNKLIAETSLKVMEANERVIEGLLQVQGGGGSRPAPGGLVPAT